MQDSPSCWYEHRPPPSTAEQCDLFDTLPRANCRIQSSATFAELRPPSSPAHLWIALMALLHTSVVLHQRFFFVNINTLNILQVPLNKIDCKAYTSKNEYPYQKEYLVAKRIISESG